jgi:hypothetical protein
MLWFFKYFRRKNCEKLAFLTKNKAKLCKFLIITLDFEKNANFFAENCQKLQKIVIITSTPGRGIESILSVPPCPVGIRSNDQELYRRKRHLETRARVFEVIFLTLKNKPQNLIYHEETKMSIKFPYCFCRWVRNQCGQMFLNRPKGSKNRPKRSQK